MQLQLLGFTSVCGMGARERKGSHTTFKRPGKSSLGKLNPQFTYGNFLKGLINLQKHQYCWTASLWDTSPSFYLFVMVKVRGSRCASPGDDVCIRALEYVTTSLFALQALMQYFLPIF